MSYEAVGTFQATSWEETASSERDDGRKLAHVRASFMYGGDLDGSSEAEYSLVYVTAETGHYAGFERMTGTLAGRMGSFVLSLTGDFDATSVSAQFTIVDGSGTGELDGIEGGGTLTWPLGGTEGTFSFTYVLPQPTRSQPALASTEA